jgi:hypothetical protein
VAGSRSERHVCRVQNSLTKSTRGARDRSNIIRCAGVVLRPETKEDILELEITRWREGVLRDQLGQVCEIGTVVPRDHGRGSHGGDCGKSGQGHRQGFEEHLDEGGGCQLRTRVGDEFGGHEVGVGVMEKVGEKKKFLGGR